MRVEDLPRHLRALPLHAGCVDSWTTSRSARLSADRVWEQDFTALLSALDGRAEELLVDFFLRAAAVERREDVRHRLVRFADLGRAVMSSTGLAPDLFVATRSIDGTAWIPRVAIEVKFGAAVNGRWDYCPTGEHDGYSDQIVCYRAGCWVAPELREAISYVWLQAGGRPRAFGPAGIARFGLDEQDAARLSAFLETRDAMWERWTRVTFDDLIEHLVSAGGPAERQARALAAVLRRTAPSVREGTHGTRG